MMTRVMVFTPTWLEGDGRMAMRDETRASLEGQALPAGVELTWEIGLHNPNPGRHHLNVLAQYQRGREMFLASDCDYLLLYEHDMELPAGGVGMLLETMAGGWDGAEVGVVYGVYMLRHGSWVLNAWEYLNDFNLGESLTTWPEKLAAARAAGVARVCGCGFGCTLIRRSVVERFPFRDGGGSQWSPDIPFAYDCIGADVMCVADMRVGCDHLDGGLRLRPYGDNHMSGMIRVRAVQSVTVIDGRGGTRRLEVDRVYEIGGALAGDLMRAGYVEEVTGGGDSAGLPGNSAGGKRKGDRAIDDGGEVGNGAETANLEASERAVTAAASPRRKRKGGG